MKQQKDNWVKILFSFAAPCKGKMALSVFCAILSVAGGFIPFWAVYEILLAFINQNVTLNGILIWCLVGAAGYLLRVACHGISTILAHISAYTILEGIRLKIADRLMKAPLGEVMGRRIGYLKNIIMDKVEDLEPPLAHMIPELTSNLLLPVAIFIWMLVIDWRMGLAVLISPVLAMIPMFFLMRNYNSQYAAYMEANNHVNSIIIEYVEGIEVVKAFNQSTSSYEKFVNAVQSFKEFTLAWFKSTWKSMNLMMAIMPTTLLGVLPVGLLLVQNGSISPAELAMGIILSLSIVGPLMKATTFINEAKSMEYAVEAANELLNLPVLPDSGKIVSIPHNDIALKHVTFSYDGSEQNEVLHDVNLELPEESFTALVGPSGGGKSTIARLIARFWDVTGGSITIGGKNVKELSIRQLSELVSFVTQDNFLFNCSLKENIRLGNPNATDEEVYAAAKAACCDEFIVRLDKGYDTPAGDAGKRLSGGEKQRIAIARAILKNAPIVILDEATAFTDPQNEDKIQKSIMALSKGKTLLVIAHRLSTIQNADQIVVLKKGRIVDCGKQEELLKRCPLYADMWKAHIGAKNWSVSEKKEVAAHV
ncbi:MULTISPECIES: ABC transporter ATP-binding protein [Bacillota]|jgi:ATP-binding cassette subfamily B protein IrtA|uniref:ATP-binding cassette domain-containing protein n=1 Tax=Holdemania massiliensis TaxID=1468449 RepID=A0A6N7S5G6_9FIRM|nr:MULTISPECIES: ABC transporter ATP-binding protein [Bacillota]MSA70413.1 ATP-binding cassette domain-containing protein [Holdemania massiliensis]MSA88870.1 ATP-binding cassette domain-containing protein [Holdemania massiliensis]MSB77491.1 ATP-binding cassette domain-containing protein [Holdemania massiliensis]MSC32417.1 ATP-binding cassette domain-containing protein [Holdemania massiliensis]MSC38737.1 ATP-binding cassette domain-containing protein [Holdemania massiliensis]